MTIELNGCENILSLHVLKVSFILFICILKQLYLTKPTQKKSKNGPLLNL